MKNKFVKLLLILVLVFVPVLAFAGCSQADIITKNIQKDANKFNVYRKMTFVNLYSDKVLYSVEGYFSLQTTYDNTYQGQQEIGIVIMTGENEFKIHYFSIANNVTYVIEQLENTHSNPYYWDIVWYVPLPNNIGG